jgi:ATP/maltotriose-dependent transcriptional regulator MalT
MADVVARAREQQHRAQSLRDLAWETWTQAIIAHARAESVQLSPVVEARLHLLLGKQSGAGGVSRRNADPGVPGRFAAELVDGLVRRPGHDLGSQRAHVQPLTERERTVLHHLAGPLTNAEIAAELHVSVHTVKTHQRSVYRKLGARGRRDAVRIARDLALL